ncbi:MAG: hypothetical protein ABSF67_06870 [Roseiarcus sp.]
MRPIAAVRYLLPLLALGVFWWERPEFVSPLMRGGIAVNLGTADQPRELVVPTAAILIAPLALRFGLPLLLKAALLAPFAATALAHRSERGPTFDPSRDLPSDSLTPGSAEEAAVDKAIAAALAARYAASPARPTFGKVDRAPGAVAPAATPPVGRRDAAA